MANDLIVTCLKIHNNGSTLDLLCRMRFFARVQESHYCAIGERAFLNEAGLFPRMLLVLTNRIAISRLAPGIIASSTLASQYSPS